MATEVELRQYLKRATAGLQQAKQRVHDLESKSSEPLAIVGMGCRFPGGVFSPEDLWDLIANQREVVMPWPADRGWDPGLYDPDPAAHGKSYVHDGGFLDIAAFDAAFFGISPHEALAMDPQHRMLLEVTWESLERAGIDPTSLRGTRTGVFTGLIHGAYGPLITSDPDGLGPFLLTGRTASCASGRVAYLLGLHGPAVTLDTACSASLVALHLATQSLRAGECDLALVGGVCAAATAEAFIHFSIQRALAPDGRCKSFASAADGTSWSEGVGVLVVERLSDARSNGRNVLALVRGSAVNQDGASNGLTAPNGPAQQRVIRQALANAGVAAAEVDVVEAHGTGTPLGDPIESHALLSTYGRERGANGPLWLGSIKSNLGHTQAAAGVAGVIKMVLAMRNRTIPATVHVDEPTTHVDWTVGDVRLATTPQDWTRNGHPRRAGVSSFGISGTNAHVILEEPPDGALPGNALPDNTTEASIAGGLVPWVVSGRSAAAVAAQAGRLLDHLGEHPDTSILDVGLSLAVSRAQLEHRAVVLGANRAALLSGLESLVAGKPGSSVIRGVAGAGAKSAIVFPGQGAQLAGMGSGLYAAFDVFAAAFDEVCAQFETEFETPLRDVIFAAPGSPAAALLDRTAYTQAAMFTVEVALFRLLQARGVRPDYLLGHSIGEVTAAYVAGVWSLADACTLVAARGKLMQALPEGAAMVAIAATENEVAEQLSRFGDDAHIAAVNGPAALVVSGTEAAVTAIAEVFEQKGRRVKRLPVSHAFHSHLMDPMLADFAAVCARLTYHEPQIAIVSNVTGALAGSAEMLSAEYWVRHVREPVRFADGVRWTFQQAHVSNFIEAGPGTALTALISAVVADLDSEAFAAIPLLRTGRAEVEAFLGGLAAVHAGGTPVAWARAFEGSGARSVDLPTYAFQRQRYWVDCPTDGTGVRSSGLADADHPLLGAVVALPDGGVLATGLLSLHTHGWLADHTISGTVLLPGTAFVEIALHLGNLVDCPQLGELILQAPLIVAADRGVELRVAATPPAEGGERTVTIHSRQQADSVKQIGEAIPWTLHATGIVAPVDTPATTTDLVEWPAPGAVAVDIGDAYAGLAELGYHYGPLFRGLKSLWRRGDEVFAEVELPEQARSAAGHFGLHPALLDAALHAIALSGAVAGSTTATLKLPFAWEGVSLAAVGATSLRVRLAATAPDRVELTLADPAGGLVARIDALSFRAITLEQLAINTTPNIGEALFSVGWVTVAANTSDNEVEWSAYAAEPAAEVDLSRLEVCSSDGEEAVVLRFDGDHGAGIADRLSGLLAQVQALLMNGTLTARTLVVVTSRAVPVHGAEDITDLAGSGAWGMLRSAQNENPGRIILVDIDNWAGYRHAVTAARTAINEPQLAMRNGVLHAPRLGRADADTVGSAAIATEPAWRLTANGKGTLTGDNMSLVADPVGDLALEPGQLRVGLRASGMNFRDVLIVLGMYPDPDAPIGGEGAGVVLEVAPDVTNFAPGDRVMGLFAGVSSMAVVDHLALSRIPDGWTFAQAAAVPAVFATAYYALVDLADLRAGEKLLIHAATGGVGMAAVQLARHLGAELFVTASAPKWDVLRAMGFDDEHIGNSRTLEFEDRFLAATDGTGVDVVLDSLAGEFVDASLRMLPRGGRFLEMGLTDLRDPGVVAEKHSGVAYRNFVLMEAGADRLREIMIELGKLFESGALQPLPIALWDVRRAPEAFKFLSQARHIGKNVLTAPVPLNPQGTVLISGGTGGLGSIAARHLVAEHGVRRLLLSSRRGPDAEGAAALSAELSALGAHVDIVACDVADSAALSALLATIPPEHPLTAVVHTAGVVDDGLFVSLTPDRLANVLRPKVTGAWNLHCATQRLDLAAFVLYSSIAGVLGAPGQANYAAANMFLDGLAQHRRTLGLPATSVAWGIWEQPTGITRHLQQRDLTRIRREGFLPISDEDGTALLDASLASGQAFVVAGRFDVAAIRANSDTEEMPPVLRGLLRATRRSADGGSGESARFVAGLHRLSSAEQERVIMDLIRSHSAAVLGHESPDAISPDQSFLDLGFDSLGAVEFRNRLEATTGSKLPTTVVFDYPTPTALAAHICQQIAAVDDSATRIMAQVQSLASVLGSVELERTDVNNIAAHLTTVLRKLQGESGNEVVADIDAAEDDELFEFIDQSTPTQRA